MDDRPIGKALFRHTEPHSWATKPTGIFVIEVTEVAAARQITGAPAYH